ncbi:MAG: hypothetical protein JW959_04540 [Pirellulales bacterium]|nr:hypothetical protein [Pirellulales bacterium]
MKVLSAVLALAVSLAVVGNLSAEENKKKGKRSDQRQSAGQMQLMRLFRGLNLSADQLKKIQATANEYSPKFREIDEKQQDILTAEQKKARLEARKKAIKDGKKGREILEAMQAAVTLTDEQKTAFEECRKERRELYREMIGKTLEVLTPEQREKIKRKLERLENRKPEDKPKEEKKSAEQ